MDDIYFIAMDYYKKKDYSNTIIYLKKGMEENDVRCINAYGNCLYNGIGIEKDEEKGKQIILSNIDALEAESKVNNGSKLNAYLAYKNVPFLKDDKKAFEVLLKMYEADDDMTEDALYDLAWYYKKGTVCECNDKKAFDLFNECYEKYHDKYSLQEIASYYLLGNDEANINSDLDKFLSLVKLGYEIDKKLFYEDLIGLYIGYNEYISQIYTNDRIQTYINYNEAIKIINELIESKTLNDEKIYLYEIIVSYLLDRNKEKAISKMNNIELKDINTFEKFWAHIVQFLDPRNISMDSYEFLNKIFYNKYFTFINIDINDICPYAKMAEVYNDILLNKEFFHLDEKQIKNFNLIQLNYLIEGEKNNDYLAMFSYAFKLLSHNNERTSIKNIDFNKVFNLLNKSVSIVDTFSMSLNYLAFCYEYGLGTDKNIITAIKYYRKSYLLNDVHANCSPPAAFNLYYLLSEKVKTPEALIEASEILKNKEIFSVFSPLFLPESGFTDLIYHKKDFYAAKLFNDYYSLGLCYLKGYGIDKNVDKAIECFEKDLSESQSNSLSIIGCIYYEGIDKTKDLNKAYNYFIKSINTKNAYFDSSAYEYLFKLYTNTEFEQFDPKKGLEYLKIAADTTDDYNVSRGEICYLLANFYYDNEFNLIDKEKANKYYKIAYDLGIDCSFAIESIERDEKLHKLYLEGIHQGKLKNLSNYELIKFAKQYAREKFISSSQKGIYNAITSLNLSNLSPIDKKTQIENLLKESFGYLWADLKDEAKDSMITALFVYSNFIALGKDVYLDLDFSAVINGLSKAFEIELKEFYFTKYLSYLKENNIAYKEFVDESTLIQLPFIESKVYVKDNEPKIKYSYVEETENKKFTLGNVYFITTSGQNKYYLNRLCNTKNEGIKIKDSFGSSSKVNTRLIDYFDTVFKKEVFPEINRKNDIAKYLINFADDVNTIKFKRNSGSHDSIMTVDDAEFCADYLIMVKKLMFSFLSIIQPEKRK